MRAPRRVVAMVLAAVAAAGCSDGEVPNALDPRGPGAADIAVLWWVMLALGVLVMVLVTVFFLWAAWAKPPTGGPRWLTGSSTRFVSFWGVGVTGVILVAVLALTIWTGARTYDVPGGDAHTEIEVIGHKFWWEVTYDDGDTVTANEIVIPAGEPVRLRLESADVIHAFWVPELHGKMDMIPGHTNQFWVQADEPGTFRGICAEFCGIQHAQMHYLVHAVEPGEFDAWLDRHRDGADEVDDDGDVARGREVYDEANCVACHDITGHVDRPTSRGPDLTHFAERDTIAAGMQPNDREHLREWIVDPQASKPGVRMPATQLADDDLEALLDYLESLE